MAENASKELTSHSGGGDIRFEVTHVHIFNTIRQDDFVRAMSGDSVKDLAWSDPKGVKLVGVHSYFNTFQPHFVSRTVLRGNAIFQKACSRWKMDAYRTFIDLFSKDLQTVGPFLA